MPMEPQQTELARATRAAELAGEACTAFNNTYMHMHMVLTSLQVTLSDYWHLADQLTLKLGSISVQTTVGGVKKGRRRVLRGQEFRDFKTTAVAKATKSLADNTAQLAIYVHAARPWLGQAAACADRLCGMHDEPLSLGRTTGRTVIQIVHEIATNVMMDLCTGVDDNTWHPAVVNAPSPDLAAQVAASLARLRPEFFYLDRLESHGLTPLLFPKWRQMLGREGSRVEVHARLSLEQAQEAAIEARTRAEVAAKSLPLHLISQVDAGILAGEVSRSAPVDPATIARWITKGRVVGGQVVKLRLHPGGMVSKTELLQKLSVLHQRKRRPRKK